MTLLLERSPAAPGIAAAIADALALARLRGETVLLSTVAAMPQSVDPLSFLEAASNDLGDGILWSQASGASFVGAGIALNITGYGMERFGDVATAVRGLRGRVIEIGETAPFPVLGGFAFSDFGGNSGQWIGFPDAKFVIPSVLVQSSPEIALRRLSVAVEPDASPDAVHQHLTALERRTAAWSTCDAFGADSASGVRPAADRQQTLTHRSVPSRTAWEATVTAAVAQIRRGSLDKVVLAREERIEATRVFPAIDALRKLRDADATATLIAMQSGASWFIGASPERLVKLDRGRVDVTCLAGSIAAGASGQERAALAAQLLASEKDRHEHEIVVASTMSALREVCDVVEREAGTPRVVLARAVQHLETPVCGYLRADGHILDLVARLHPTPAVGGFPRGRALAAIANLETIARGWYAGPFGWTDLDGSGEFSVAIRSALLNGATASVYAGCGIVADSDPESEFAETCLKMLPMLAALDVA